MDIYIRVYFVEVKSYRVIETIFVGDFYEFKLAPRESVHDGEKWNWIIPDLCEIYKLIVQS